MTTQQNSTTDITDILQAVREGLEKANETLNGQEWYLLAVLWDAVVMAESRQRFSV